MKNIIRLSAEAFIRKAEGMDGEGEIEAPERTYVQIAGIANATTVDRIGDLIPKDAWNLVNYLKNPVMLWEHSGHHPIGKVLKIEPRDDGLYFEAEIGSKTEEITEKQEEVISLLRQGILKSFSVGFIPRASERKEDIYWIKDAELLEISLVSVPMNQDSLLTSLKSIENIDNDSKNVPQLDSQGAANANDNSNANGGSMEEMKAALAAMCEEMKACHGKVDKMCNKMFPDDNQEGNPKPEDSEQKPDLQQELSALKDELAATKSALDKANAENATICEAIVRSRCK
jgi:HK97 family phage prohead protease